jgi:hypothetical protein
MQRVSLIWLPVFLTLGLPRPSLAADLDGPGYVERDRVIVERPAAPKVIERERIIERNYYEPAPVYAPPPRVYYEDSYYDVPRPYVYAYGYRPHYWRPRQAYFVRPWWRHRWHRW